MGTSRAVLGKQSRKGSRQLVPDRKIDTKCWLIAFFLLVPQVRTRTKKRTERKHDMKYFCFRRNGGDLTALHSEALLFCDGVVNMLLKLLELLDSTQTPSAGLVDCAGKGRLDLEGNQHIVSTCFKVSFSLALSILQANVASSSKVHQQLKTSTQEQCQVSNQAKVPGSRFLTRSLSGGSDILLSLSLSLQVRTRTNEKTGRKHDIRYSCFLPW
ncbi:hypothetical protein TB2_011157 [Malus domestica]